MRRAANQQGGIGSRDPMQYLEISLINVGRHESVKTIKTLIDIDVWALSLIVFF